MADPLVSNNFIIPRVVHRASAALPAAGAFDLAQAFFAVPGGTQDLTLYCVYTEGAVGGFPAYRVEVGNGTEQVRQTLIDGSSLVIVQPNATVKLAMSELNGPTGTSSYALEFCLKRGVTQIRLIAAERGVPGTPGTLLITLTGGG